MTALSALWLPILLSAVLVFVASSVFHMVLKWHTNDYRKMPNEDQVRAALQPLAIPPGDYAVADFVSTYSRATVRERLGFYKQESSWKFSAHQWNKIQD